MALRAPAPPKTHNTSQQHRRPRPRKRAPHPPPRDQSDRSQSPSASPSRKGFLPTLSPTLRVTSTTVARDPGHLHPANLTNSDVLQFGQKFGLKKEQLHDIQQQMGLQHTAASLARLANEVNRKCRMHEQMCTAVQRANELVKDIDKDPPTEGLDAFAHSFISGVNSSLYRSAIAKLKHQRLEKEMLNPKPPPPPPPPPEPEPEPTPEPEEPTYEDDDDDEDDEEQMRLLGPGLEDDVADSDAEKESFLGYLSGYAQTPSPYKVNANAAQCMRAISRRVHDTSQFLAYAQSCLQIESHVKQPKHIYRAIRHSLETSHRKTNHAIQLLRGLKQYTQESNIEMAKIQADEQEKILLLEDKLKKKRQKNAELKAELEAKRKLARERELAERPPELPENARVKNIRDELLGTKDRQLLRLLELKFERQIDWFLTKNKLINPVHSDDPKKKKRVRDLRAGVIIQQQKLVQVATISTSQYLMEEKARQEHRMQMWYTSWLGDDFSSTKRDTRQSIIVFLVKIHRYTRVFVDLVNSFLADKESVMAINDEGQFWREWTRETGMPAPTKALESASAVLSQTNISATKTNKAILTLLAQIFSVLKTYKKVRTGTKNAMWEVAIAKREAKKLLAIYRSKGEASATTPGTQPPRGFSISGGPSSSFYLT
eukprot:TRINITY_DN75737_c0_g1_i1.p1 TRINITY_DN75737_c0_g1~~TRINITY_DN75737_c0_g1_i1.p1  ORF type:complete len:658 (+),score=76.36 TRINITY_DN75737_c0_g1_i1:89-2062(+)